MSFSKAEIKRFNDASGCAPPVGAYDPRDGKKTAGGVIEKSDRFKHPKVENMSSTLSCSNPNLCSTPIKGNSSLSLSKISFASSESLASNKSTKATAKKPAQVGEHLAKIKELEQEIRRLLHEKGVKDKELNRLRQDHERLEGRLTAANAELSANMSRSAQLEQKARDANRGLEVLQKQVTSTELSGRKKDERLKEEVQGLQSQILSKEQEIQHTQRQIAHAMLALITDVQHCATHSDKLAPLFSRLELSADMMASEDDDKLVASDSDTGIKQFDSQIRKARHDIRRVSRTLLPLAERGAEQVEMLGARLQEDHQRHLQELTQQLMDIQTCIHQKEMQCDTHRAQIEQLEKACESGRQELEQAVGEKKSVEQQLRAEHEAVLEERRALVLKEQEQLQEQLQAALEDCMQKDARLGELHSCLMEKQEEHEVVTAALKDQLSGLQSEMSQAQLDLQHKQELLQQLQENLQDSQDCKARLQDQLQQLQEEERQLRESRDSLQIEKETTEKELEIKKTLLTEAMKENAMLDASIRSLTAKFQASIQDLELALDEEKQKVGQMTAWICVLEEEQARTKQELNQTQAVNKDLVNSLSSSRDEVSSLRSASQDLKEQLQQERGAKLTLETEVQDMRQQLEEERSTIDSLRSSLSDTEQLHQAAVREGEQRVEEEQGVIANLQAQLKTLQLTKDDCESVAQRVLQEASQRAEQLKDEVSSLHSASQDLKEQLQQERGAKLTLETEVQDMRQQLEEERSTIDSLRSSLADTEQLHQAAVREGKQRVEEGQGVIADLQAQLKTLQLTMDDRESAAQRVLQEVSQCAEQLKVENKQHRIANTALKGQLTQLTGQHNREVHQLHHKYNSLMQERLHLSEKHQEDLESVRKAVALDRQANNLQMDELNMKLDRAQAFNTQLKEEMKKLLKDNEKLKDDRKAEVSSLEVKVEAAEAKAAEVSGQLDLLRHQAKHAQAECLRLKNSVEEAQEEVRVKEEEVEELKCRLEECHSAMAATEDKIGELMAEKEALEDHLNRLSEEHTVLDSDLERQLETVRAAALEEREGYEKIISEMSEKIQQLETMPASNEDDENWQQKYEDLFARVEPFLEQLDAYAAEKDYLLGRNQLAEAEVSRLMDKYAKMVGHQNHKQKIQYLGKLKNEYLQCRKEKEALQEKCNKQQQTIQRLEKKNQTLEKKNQTLEGHRTFDPSQAFNLSFSKKVDSAPNKPLKPALQPSSAASAAKLVDRKGIKGQEEMVTRSPLKQTNK